MDSSKLYQKTTPEEYARMLKKIMDSQHLTIDQVAEKLGVSRQRVVELLQGDKQMEPECVCPMMRGGGIRHEPNCAYIADKKGYKVVKPEPKPPEQEIVLRLGAVCDMPVHLLKEGSSVRASYDPYVFQCLKDSIKKQGVVVPISVSTKGVIVDGVARWRAAVELGHIDIPVQVDC